MIHINLMPKPKQDMTLKRMNAARVAALKISLYHAHNVISAQDKIIRIAELVKISNGVRT